MNDPLTCQTRITIQATTLSTPPQLLLPVGDAVDDEVVHEAGEDDDPSPAAVGRGGQLEHGHHI